MSRPSIGKDSTSVDSSCPRCSRFKVRISSGPTKRSPRSPSSMPSAMSTRRASSSAPCSSTKVPLLFSTTTVTTASLPTLRAGLLRVLAVRLHDALDELVPDNVLVAEADERDAVERAEDVLHLNQARRLLARQVDLGHVARDDDLRAEPEPRQEHLHLLGARVLRLVENDERIVQRATPHERERRHLDDALLHVRGEPVGVEHVVERVEERTKVRIDLLEHRPREVAEPLAGLDRGTRENDPAHLPVGERRDRQGHGQIRLARSGWADPEGDDAVADRVDVALLGDGFRRDLLATVAPDDVLEDLADVLDLLERAEHGVDGGRADLVAAFGKLDELVDNR